MTESELLQRVKDLEEEVQSQADWIARLQDMIIDVSVQVKEHTHWSDGDGETSEAELKGIHL